MKISLDGIVMVEGESIASRRGKQPPIWGSITDSIKRHPHIPAPKKRRNKVMLEITAVREVLRCPRLTEAEAARVLRMPAKTLGNLRRDGSLPRDMYIQNGKGHKTFYITEVVLEYAKNQRKPRGKRS